MVRTDAVCEIRGSAIRRPRRRPAVPRDGAAQASPPSREPVHQTTSRSGSRPCRPRPRRRAREPHLPTATVRPRRGRTHAVANTTGHVAASSALRFAGARTKLRLGAVMWDAKASGDEAHDEVALLQVVDVVAHAQYAPGAFEAKGASGPNRHRGCRRRERPERPWTSRKFKPVASTSTSISSGPGCVRGSPAPGEIIERRSGIRLQHGTQVRSGTRLDSNTARDAWR